VVEQLAGVGKQVFAIVGEYGKETTFIFCGTNNTGFAGDAGVPGCVYQGDAKASYFIDQAERKGLLAGPDLARGLILSSVVWRLVATSWTNWVNMLSTRDWK
jgi:hypothetical protein